MPAVWGSMALLETCSFDAMLCAAVLCSARPCSICTNARNHYEEHAAMLRGTCSAAVGNMQHSCEEHAASPTYV
eukprot:363453-Chlamydomonas_euryale.AAC.10